jgi:glycosyltransferase involved in cell wall biosynthesis
MKIAFISIIREPWGGSEELWAASAHELLNQKHTVLVSALNTGTVSPRMQQLLDKGAKLIYRRGFIRPGIAVKKRVLLKIWHFFLNQFSNPYRELFREKPDVIVYTGACDSLKDDPFFLKQLYASGIPLVIINQVHTEYTRTFDAREADVLFNAFTYAAANLFVSERNLRVMERFLGRHIPKAQVVRNPVNLTDTSPIPYPPMDGDVQLAMVGNLLINHKGQDLALEALSSGKWKARNWKLNIYGSGIDEKYLKDLTIFYGLEQKVIFHGKVNDIRSVWEKNHLLLMPSRLEGIPLAVVEAMLCGRPAVATDVAGHTEWITEGQQGFIAEGANVLSLGRALEKAWQQKEDWEKLGADAAVRAQELYDPQPGLSLAKIILSTGKV